MSRHGLLACFVALLPLAAGAAVDPALFQDLHWRLIGPFRGGRVLAVSGVAGEPEHFYFGSVNGGVWETRDAGRTWQPIFDSQPIGSIGALAVAPSQPSVLYVGSGEADMRSDIAQGDGMYKSADAGKSWTHIGLDDSQQIGCIRVHPDDPDVVFVAALGHPYGPNAERGVFRSKDGGRSWQKVLGPDDATGAIDLAFEPGRPRVIYAALWRTRRTPWNIYPPADGPGSGLYKSTDGGDTWTELRGHGLPENPGRIGIAVAPSQPQRVYAIIDAAAGGMYRSDDGGATWTRTSDDKRIWSRGWYFGGVTVAPGDADVVYSCNVNLYRSQDGGKTFVPVKGAPGGDDYHTLWIDPRDPERQILGVDQGAVVTLNGGRTWSSWYNQPTGQFYHVITDDRFPYRVYGSQQDSGAGVVPSRTGQFDGIALGDFGEITAGGESDNVAPDPLDPDILYGGRVDKLDLRTHQTHPVDPTLASAEKDRATWTLPLVFSHRDPHVLYFANQRLFRTDDGGAHWRAISPDLTRADPGVPANLDAVTAAHKPRAGTRHGVIYAIAPSRLADHDIWVGTDDGCIWRTRDEGAHWDNLTPPQLGGWSKVGIIETSHFDADAAYAAIDRHRLDDFRPFIYRTHDGGKSWQAIATGIPAGCFVNAVREDPVHRGLLYAGTEKGIYVSFDDGDHWQSLQLNLPVTSVRDIDVHGDDVVIATHGRAFWILDDVTPLRQQDAAGAAGGSRLYRPATALRMRPAGFTGTPMPKDEPLASDPPAGACIDYVVAPGAGATASTSADSARAAEITLEILDAQGGLVRRYSSTDRPPTADPAKLRTAREWFRTPSALASSPGMHRFVWPLRYPAPKALAEGFGAYADGVWAPPGDYTVALVVQGNRQTQPLVVAPDPRVNLPASAYAEQFALARQVEALRARVSAALDEAQTLVSKLYERRSGDTRSPGPHPSRTGRDLDRALEALRSRAIEVSDAIWSNNPRNSWWLEPQRPTSLRALDGRLAKLAAAVDRADGAPTADARAGWEQMRPAAEATVQAWEKFKAQDLAAVNARLQAAEQAILELK